MKTIEVIERTNARDAAARTCSHNTSRFFQWAYKNDWVSWCMVNLNFLSNS